jgi:hypothetical protein
MMLAEQPLDHIRNVDRGTMRQQELPARGGEHDEGRAVLRRDLHAEAGKAGVPVDRV